MLLAMGSRREHACPVAAAVQTMHAISRGRLGRTHVGIDGGSSIPGAQCDEYFVLVEHECFGVAIAKLPLIVQPRPTPARKLAGAIVMNLVDTVAIVGIAAQAVLSGAYVSRAATIGRAARLIEDDRADRQRCEAIIMGKPARLPVAIELCVGGIGLDAVRRQPADQLVVGHPQAPAGRTQPDVVAILWIHREGGRAP